MHIVIVHCKRLISGLLIFSLVACSSLPSIMQAPAPISHNSAVLDLLSESQSYTDAGQYAQSKAALERALRLEPRNAHLWLELAEVNRLDRQINTAKSMALRAKGMTRDPGLITRIERFVDRL